MAAERKGRTSCLESGAKERKHLVCFKSTQAIWLQGTLCWACLNPYSEVSLGAVIVCCLLGLHSDLNENRNITASLPVLSEHQVLC